MLQQQFKGYQVTDYSFIHRDTINVALQQHQDVSSTTHPYIDGESAKQKNGFDCGVFALANVEDYVRGPGNFLPISQRLMKLHRCRYLLQLYDFATEIAVGASNL